MRCLGKLHIAACNGPFKGYGVSERVQVRVQLRADRLEVNIQSSSKGV